MLNYLYHETFKQDSVPEKTSMIHQTCVQWALYILFKFVKSLIGHLGLAIGNVRCIWWLSWTLQDFNNFIIIQYLPARPLIPWMDVLLATDADAQSIDMKQLKHVEMDAETKLKCVTRLCIFGINS